MQELFNDRAPRSAKEEQLMSTPVFPLAADDRDRERALRERFIQFWTTATGDPRAIYDTFISATPRMSTARN